MSKPETPNPSIPKRTGSVLVQPAEGPFVPDLDTYNAALRQRDVYKERYNDYYKRWYKARWYHRKFVPAILLTIVLALVAVGIIGVVLSTRMARVPQLQCDGQNQSVRVRYDHGHATAECEER